MRRTGIVMLCLAMIPTGPAEAEKMRVIVPAYFYPDAAHRADWNRLAEAARSVPLDVIIDPANGPGTKRDANYVEVVGQLRKAGARVLGYVDSDYGRRPLDAVERDLRTFPRFYPIDGYFIDQMANSPEMVDHHRSIRELIHRIDPDMRVVGNPGTSTRPEYLDTADTLLIFEGSAKQFDRADPRKAMPWMADHPPHRFAVIVYEVRPTTMRESLKRMNRSGASAVFLTDQTMPNPYLGLPPYWSDQVEAVRAIQQPAEPAKRR